MNADVNGNHHTQVKNPEFEWESLEASHYAPSQSFESEAEGEYFFKRMLGGIQKAARAAVPIARHLAPTIAKTLLGSTTSPVPITLLQTLLREGETSAVALESTLFGSNPTDAEVSHTEVAHEAALAEVLAAEASHSGSASEAEAFLGAAVPGIVKSMGGQTALRSVLPTLVMANARLVQFLHQQGTEGQRLLRLVPTILRYTIASLKSAQQAGRPINSGLALRLFASHASKVFSNPQTVAGGIIRNAVIQKQTTR